MAVEAGVAATVLSVASAVAAFGSVPTGVGPVAGVIGTTVFGALAIQQCVTASHFLDQAIEDFRPAAGIVVLFVTRPGTNETSLKKTKDCTHDPADCDRGYGGCLDASS